ncbi:hypothetical protein [Shewanella cutis]|uniref:SMODS and SLOG-associating 2TM effector domain-containing protein n=1 Tax=Shewanella cutis TaxID=2766780 RepID=A0ABS9QZQ4_9GAMM|nr:hypothetical protein [Shewanella sp. PS-2]MCG9965205.1 hypothetical protein [Shewanella sp. PS-2]
MALYEKLYQEEVNRGELLNARLNVPLTVFAAVGGLLAFVFQNIPIAFSNVEMKLFWALWVFACLSLSVACYFFYRAWYGRKNLLFHTASTLDQYYLDLRKNYFGFPNAQKNRETHFNNWLLNSYKEYATVNALNNDIKSKRITMVTLFSGIAFCLAFLTLIPYKLIVDESKTTPQKKEPIECQINVTLPRLHHLHQHGTSGATNQCRYHRLHHPSHEDKCPRL